MALLSVFENVSSRLGKFARAFLAVCAVAVILHAVQPGARAQSLPGRRGVEEGYFVGADKVRLFYRKLGNGNDVVVFLHGGPGADIHDGGYLMDPLGQRHVLVMYDQRGGGRSDLTTQPGMLTIDAEIRDLEALRQHFGVEKMSLVGLSWGAGLAAYYVAAHPKNVSRIVFLSPMPIARRYVEERDRREKSLLSKEDASRLEALEQEMKTAPDDKVYSLCSEHDRISYGLYLVHPERLKGSSCCNMCTASPAAIRNSPAVFRVVEGSLHDFDMRPMLRKLNVPVLVIEGAKTIVPLDSTREWAKAPPDARILLIPDAGHACFVDQTDAVLKAIQSFLSGTWPPEAVTPARSR